LMGILDAVKTVDMPRPFHVHKGPEDLGGPLEPSEN
jgi:hypothetical protein